MILSPKQKYSILNANSRINIWDGAVRSGKTLSSILKWAHWLGKQAPPGNLAMIGRTERTLETNVLKEMSDLFGGSFTYSMGSHKAQLFGRELLLYGANDARAELKIRGSTLAGAYCDEVTILVESFFKMLLSRMSVKGAKLFGTTNPDSPNHWLKKSFLDRIDVLDLQRFIFRLEDNESLDSEYVRNLKNEYVGLWHKRFIEGLWVVAEGAVYDFFEEIPPYVLSICPRPQYYVVGVDYGIQNPTVFILFGVNLKTKPKIWAIKEYYYDGRASQKQKTDSEYSADMKAWLGDVKPRKIFVDPSAASFIVQLKRDGLIGVREHTNNSVIDGIRTQARMLKNGDYAISTNCPHTIGEYSGYLWDPKAQLRGEDKPIKESDHCMDATRYVLHTMFGSFNFNSVLNKL